jgi:hypothetical protein
MFIWIYSKMIFVINYEISANVQELARRTNLTHTHTQTHAQTHVQTHAQTHTHTDRHTHRHIQTDTQTDRHRQTHTHSHTHTQTYVYADRHGDCFKKMTGPITFDCCYLFLFHNFLNTPVVLIMNSTSSPLSFYVRFFSSRYAVWLPCMVLN